MERAAKIDETKVSSHVSEGRQRVSADQEALIDKIREVARIRDNLTRAMEDANLNELGLAIPCNISIMAPSELGVRGTSLVIPKTAAQEAVDNNVGLIFNTGTVSFNLPAEVIGALISTSEDVNNLEISVQTVEEDVEDNGPEGMNLLGDPLDLNISAQDGEGLEFKPASYGAKVIVTVSLAGIDLSKTNPEKLVVYRQVERYNETTGQVETGWECVGGRISNDGKSIIFETDHTSIYAVFASNITFQDIQKHWAKEQVEVLAARQIIKGLTQDTFGPEISVTRAQFTAIVLRALGIAEKSGPSQTFIDVKPGTWYYSAVETAYAKGLVDGVGNGRFDPGRQISRQEMAVLIARALQQTGADISIGSDEINNNLKRFKDRDEIAAWAQESVAKAVELGIITGRTQDTFVGKANATRAESAVMVYRMLKKAGQI
jgi:lactocepin